MVVQADIAQLLSQHGSFLDDQLAALTEFKLNAHLKMEQFR